MTKELVNINLPKSNNLTINFGKNCWLVLLHTSRIPPHVGILIDGSYNSLTIKGHELNINYEVLFKTISQKKIESTFIKIIPHPVFSSYYQLELLQETIKQFNKVESNGATCLSPIKIFFNELYALPIFDDELLFEFVLRLNENKFITEFVQINEIEKVDQLILPFYSATTLQKKIIEANNWHSTL